MKLGKHTFDKPIFLAPLAGVSDRPFRILASRFGADMVFTEMVSAKAIAFNNQKTSQLLAVSPELETVAIQLFGNDPKIMAESAKRIVHDGIAAIDVNMGCPVPKVVNILEGSALMKDPDRVARIVEALVEAVEVPVTVKIRAGFDAEHKNAVEVALAAQNAGAAMVAVHGRTREQFYTGKADWQIIADVKKALSIPVVGNGDIFLPNDAKAMFEQTGCDGVMVARGAQGNPWIFQEIKHYMATGELLERPSVDEIIGMMLEHRDLLVEEKGTFIALREMRKHVAWYTKGLYNSTVLRQEINKLEDMAEFERLICHILKG